MKTLNAYFGYIAATAVRSHSVFVLSVLGTVNLGAQQSLRDIDIVKMVKSHVDTDVIVQKIRTSPGNYGVTPMDLTYWRGMGFPEPVVAAMQEKMAAAANMKLSVRPESHARWQQQVGKDAMTGQTQSYLAATVTGDPVGMFDVRASCSSQNLVVSLATRNNKLLLKRTPISQTIHDYGVVGTIDAPKSCTMMRVRIGDNPVQLVQSIDCDSNDHVTFNIMGSLGFDGDARSMKVELPFTSGESSVVQVNLQDPELKQMLDRCFGWHYSSKEKGARHPPGIANWRLVAGPSGVSTSCAVTPTQGASLLRSSLYRTPDVNGHPDEKGWLVVDTVDLGRFPGPKESMSNDYIRKPGKYWYKLEVVDDSSTLAGRFNAPPIPAVVGPKVWRFPPTEQR